MHSIDMVDERFRPHVSRSIYRPASRPYPPRLPTPEASRSSDGSIECQITPSDPRGDVPFSRMSNRRATDVDLPPSQPSTKHLLTRLDGRLDAVPHSPPYRQSDDHKPSLPPIKTVGLLSNLKRRFSADNDQILADAISSPPETPRTQDASLQPSPCEPTVLAYTFKPPALYPNKKARRETGLQTSNAGIATTLSPPAGRPFERKHAREVSHSTHASPRFHAAQSYRRRSLQPSFSQSGPPSPSSFPHFTFPHSGPNVPGFYAGGTERDRPTREAMSFDRVPWSPVSRPSYARPNALWVPVGQNSTAAASAQRPSDSPFQASRICQPRPPYRPRMDDARPSSTEMHCLSTPRDEYHHLLDRPPLEHHRRNSIPVDSGMCRDPYHGGQPAFFMPAQYDYQQGKTRKRSNLPKQSTEIMKTWFDQVRRPPVPIIPGSSC